MRVAIERERDGDDAQVSQRADKVWGKSMLGVATCCLSLWQAGKSSAAVTPFVYLPKAAAAAVWSH